MQLMVSNHLNKIKLQVSYKCKRIVKHNGIHNVKKRYIRGEDRRDRIISAELI